MSQLNKFLINSEGQLSLEAEKTWLQYECERWGLKFNLECKYLLNRVLIIDLHTEIDYLFFQPSAMSHQEESQSTPALIHVPESLELTSSLGMIPENTLLESYTRLSVSLEENGLFHVSLL